MTTDLRTIAAAVSSAFLAAGDWTAEGLRERGTVAVGRRAFVRRVADEVLLAYREPPRDRPRELTAFLVESASLRAAVRRAGRSSRQIHVLTRLPGAPPELRLVSRSLPVIATTAALARWLGLTDAELDWYADVRSWERTRARDDRLRHYTYRWVRTRSGERLLERPRPVLISLQRRVLREIVARIPVHDAAHGFVPGRSVHSFAAPHAGRRVVVRVDLRGFFTSVSAGRIWSVLRLAGYPEGVAHVLTGLTTNAAPRQALRGHGTERQRMLLAHPHLPQGAPTSPALANLVATRLDRRLVGLAEAHGFRYSRYADDLAFSTDGGGADRLLAVVDRIVTEEGFQIHPDKVSVQRSGQRQRLAGLVVNDRPRLARRDVDQLRAVLHDAAVNGPAAANRDGVAHFREHLQGRVAWAGHGDPGRARRLTELFATITWDEA